MSLAELFYAKQSSRSLVSGLSRSSRVARRTQHARSTLPAASRWRCSKHGECSAECPGRSLYKMPAWGASPFAPYLERIVPAKSGKPCKVPIGGAEGEAMFNRERSQMSIGDKIGSRDGMAQQGTEDLLMALRGLGNPYRPARRESAATRWSGLDTG